MTIQQSLSPNRQSVGANLRAARLHLVFSATFLALPSACEEEGEHLQERALPGDGAVVTLVSVSANKCVDIPNGDPRNGNALQIWECNNTTAQRFTLQPASNGYVLLRNVATNKCLDVYEWSTQAGATIAQWDCHGGSNQQWELEEVGNGVAIVRSRHSGLLLDVYGNGTANGTRIIQWNDHGGRNQEFRVQTVGSNPPPPPPSGPEKFVGNITTSGNVRSDFVQYWDQITPENEGKWGSVERQRDVMDWSGLDRVYAYARQHGIPVKQHTLVWGAQQPSWIAGLPPDQQREEVEEWIRLFCERYPDTALIDVVNEPPPHTTPPYANALGGAGSSGYDWIIWSFQKTRQYCPNAELILNDYNVLRWNTRSFIDIVNAVKGSGYIDALGAQAHGLETISTQELRSNLDAVLATGLPLYISEYDLSIADDNQQLAVMREQFPLFYENDRIKGITLWGYVHGATWVPDSGLIRNGQPRPAMTWLMDYLDR